MKTVLLHNGVTWLLVVENESGESVEIPIPDSYKNELETIGVEIYNGDN